VSVGAAQEVFSISFSAFASCAAHTDNRSKKSYSVAEFSPNDCRCHPKSFFRGPIRQLLAVDLCIVPHIDRQRRVKKDLLYQPCVFMLAG